VPQVLRISLCGQTNMDDSLRGRMNRRICEQEGVSRAPAGRERTSSSASRSSKQETEKRDITYLSKYASTSSPSITLRTLHCTSSSILSHTDFSTCLNPVHRSLLVAFDAAARPPWIGSWRATTSSSEGANQISRSFSGPVGFESSRGSMSVGRFLTFQA
jgi:hypothetical protein